MFVFKLKHYIMVLWKSLLSCYKQQHNAETNTNRPKTKVNYITKSLEILLLVAKLIEKKETKKLNQCISSEIIVTKGLFGKRSAGDRIKMLFFKACIETILFRSRKAWTIRENTRRWDKRRALLSFHNLHVQLIFCIKNKQWNVNCKNTDFFSW